MCFRPSSLLLFCIIMFMHIDNIKKKNKTKKDDIKDKVIIYESQNFPTLLLGTIISPKLKKN